MPKERVAGIDVSAAKLVVAIDGGSDVSTFDNDDEGHGKLVRYLKKHRVVRVIIEPTGNYGFDAMWAIHGGGIAVMAVNPRASRAFARAQMKRSKTDRVDACVLLAYGHAMDFVRWVPPRATVIELRGIARRLEQVVRTVAAEKTRLHAAGATKNTPAVVLRSLDAMISVLETEAEALVEAALDVAAGDDDLNRSLALLTTIRGVADRTAVKLVAELATLPSDLTPRQLVAMVGLDPRAVESGAFKGQRRISKAGNPHVRATLYMAAHNAILYEPVVKSLFDHLVAHGKHPMKAKTAVMRKLLHAMWGMLQSKTEFNPVLFRGPNRAAA